MHITRTLSRYIAESRFDALPAEVRHEGVRAFVNWVGCAVGGSHEDNVQRALSLLMEFNGASEATVVGRREKLDALNATFINSMSEKTSDQLLTVFADDASERILAECWRIAEYPRVDTLCGLLAA